VTLEISRSGEVFLAGFHVANVQPTASGPLGEEQLREISFATAETDDLGDEITDLRQKLEDRMAIYISEAGTIHLDGYDLTHMDNRYDNHSVKVGDVRELLHRLKLLKPQPSETNKMDATAQQTLLERIADALETIAKNGIAPATGEKSKGRATSKPKDKPAEPEIPKREEVLKAVGDAVERGSREAVVEVFAKFDASKLSEVPEKKWAELLAGMQAVEKKEPESFE